METFDTRKAKNRLYILMLIVFTLLTVVSSYAFTCSLADVSDVTRKYIYMALIIAGDIVFTALFSFYIMEAYDKKLLSVLYTDALTKGRNYSKFLTDAQRMLDDAGEQKYAVFYADIQNFKYINDTFGYDVGDRLLTFIAERLESALREAGGIFARVSADNFTAIVAYKDKNEFIETIYSIIDDVCWNDEIQRENYKPEIYVGIFCSGDVDVKFNISEMVDRANMAQKSIKGSSEYHIAFYNEEIRERLIAEKDLERRMETALANEEFVAYYQPKYDVESGEIVGAEALVRWDSPTGFMTPAKFIPLFEQNGFIINLDQYIFESVCKAVRYWLDNGKKAVPISINVSRLQFYRLDFVKRYTKIKDKYEIPDGILELEFTESIVFENLELLKKIVLSLKKAGFMCSIDDFGSGYSSLNVLKNLPMDTLKLDRLFFKDSENVERDKALITSVVTMARALNMKTVAEGIETWPQVSFLKEIGCDTIQGYVYSEPIPQSRFEMLVEGKGVKVPKLEQFKTPLDADEKDPKVLADKYNAVLGLLVGFVAEVDFNLDTYKFLNNIGLRIPWLKSEGKYSETLEKLITEMVSPDDADSVRKRCLPIGAVSSFYQGEKRIITSARIFNKETNDYIWIRIMISRLNPLDKNDFRAVFYAESPELSRSSNISDLPEIAGVHGDSLLPAFGDICTFLYEADLEAGHFDKIYCDESKVGKQPDSADIQWFLEIYLKKFGLSDSEFTRARQFFDPQNINEHFKNGQLSFSDNFRAKFNGKMMTAFITIGKIRDQASGRERVIISCHAEDADTAGDSVQLREAVSGVINGFSDDIIITDTDKDEYTVYKISDPQVKKADSKGSYSENYNKFIDQYVNDDDKKKFTDTFSPSAIADMLSDRHSKTSVCQFRCATDKDKKEWKRFTAVVMAAGEKEPSKVMIFVREN